MEQIIVTNYEQIKRCSKSVYYAVSLQLSPNSWINFNQQSILQWQLSNKGALSSATHMLLLTSNRPSDMH